MTSMKNMINVSWIMKGVRKEKVAVRKRKEARRKGESRK